MASRRHCRRSHFVRQCHRNRRRLSRPFRDDCLLRISLKYLPLASREAFCSRSAQATLKVMASSRLFWKLFLTAAGFNLAGAVVIGAFVSHWMQGALVDVNEARRWLWVLVGAECACVWGLSYWVIGRVIRPVSTLNDAADAIAIGDYGHRVYVPSRDELGRLAGTLNRMSQDMHARTTQLSQTAARQSTVLGGMIEGVVAVDARQRIVLANEAARRLFDFRPPTVEGRSLLEVIRNHELHEAVTTVLTTSEPQRFEVRRVGSAGAVCPYSRATVAGRAVSGRRAGDSRYDCAAPAGVDSPRVRRERIA